MYRRLMLLVVLLFATVVVAQNAKTVFLVRHAEKTSEARDAQLSEVGRKRAACLAGVLADAGVQNIIASDVARTQQTAQPLADRLQKKITTIPAANTTQFTKQIRDASGNTLVVAHSDTLPNIIEQLTGKTVTIGSSDFDRLFIVSFDPNPAAPVLIHYCTASQNEVSPQKMVR